MFSSSLFSKKGFTLVEMMVSVGIFTAISAIILYNYPEFNNRAALDNLSHQIALSIREAQVYGISVRAEQALYPGYGVYFQEATPKSFLLFADKDDDKAYDAGEEVSKFDLQGGDTISDLCYNTQSYAYLYFGQYYCSLGTLTIIFTRPDPDAVMSAYHTGGFQVPSTGIISSEIVLTSRRGNYKKIIQVYVTGQITVRTLAGT